LPLSEFPPLRQDIAVVVPDDRPASEVLAAARAAGGELLGDVQVFDVYRDAEALGPGRRSLALRLTFQAQDRTLSDEEVRPFREAIVEHFDTYDMLRGDEPYKYDLGAKDRWLGRLEALRS